MSIRTTTEIICDLCGVELHCEQSVMENNPSYPLRIPDGAQLYRHRVRSQYLDLCGDCSQPLRDALEAKIGVLRVDGRLAGYPQKTK